MKAARLFSEGSNLMAKENTVLRFNSLYDSTHKKVLAYITAKCGSLADVGDIFQETYTEVFACLAKRGAQFIQNDEAFAIRVAKQKIHRHYSLAKRLTRFVPLTTEDADGADPVAWEADSFDVEDAAVDSLLMEDVRRYLAAKPDDVRRIFTLFYSLDQTIPEIAALLGTSESNIKNKLYRTLKELRQLYQ
jgi:RNA polymerase sigma-70 factor (ECF subfamily)